MASIGSFDDRTPQEPLPPPGTARPGAELFDPLCRSWTPVWLPFQFGTRALSWGQQTLENKGEGELGVRKLGDYLVARYGTLADAKRALGDMGTIKKAYQSAQAELYRQ